jgi:hypothetical protein
MIGKGKITCAIGATEGLRDKVVEGAFIIEDKGI